MSLTIQGDQRDGEIERNTLYCAESITASGRRNQVDNRSYTVEFGQHMRWGGMKVFFFTIMKYFRE